LEHYQFAIWLLLTLAGCILCAATLEADKENRLFLALLLVMTLVGITIHGMRLVLS